MKKILLVDDSKVVGKMLASTLEQSGYSVINCQDVDSAILAFREHETSIDLVVTDLIMPDKDGYELVDYLHKNSVPGRRPKIIVISGGSKGTVDASTAVSAIKDHVEMFMIKPFKANDLIMAVKSVLC